MTAPSEHEAFLRAALHAAADSLDPRGDGLERVRTRLERARPRAVVWLIAVWNELQMRAPALVQDVFYRVRADLLVAWDRYAPGSAPGRHRTRTQSWLRPLTAMTVVMFIVAAGTYVAIDISTAVSPSSSSSNQHGGTPTGSGGKVGSSPSPSPSHTTSVSGSSGRKTSPSPTCQPAASPGPSASSSCQSTTSPQPSSSAQPSPSASASPSPSASSNPSPTPTDTSDSPSQ